MIADLAPSRQILLALAAAGLLAGLSRVAAGSTPGGGAVPAPTSPPATASYEALVSSPADSAAADSSRSGPHRLRLEIRLPDGGDSFEGTVRLPVRRSVDTIRWVRGELEIEQLRVRGPDSARVSLAGGDADTVSVAVERTPTPTGPEDAEPDSVAADSLRSPEDAAADSTEHPAEEADSLDVRPDSIAVGSMAVPDTLVVGFRGSIADLLERRSRAEGELPAIWTPPAAARTSPWFPVPLPPDSIAGVELTVLADTAYAVAGPGRRAGRQESGEDGGSDEASRRATRFLLEEPVALEDLGWAAGPWTVVPRSRPLGGEGPTEEAYLPPNRTESATEILDLVRTLTPALESVTGRERPAEHLRIAAIPGLHEPGPDPPGLTLVVDSLFGAPLPPLLSSRAYPVARALADQWTAPPLSPETPGWVRDGWAPYAALRALEHRGDSVEATRVLRRAQRRLPTRSPDVDARRSASSFESLRARGLWVWLLLDRARPGAAPASQLSRASLQRAIRRTGPDRPHVRIRYGPAPGGDSLQVTIERDTSEARAPGRAAPFDLTLEVGTAGGPRRFDVPVPAGTRTLRLPVSGGADFVVADPANAWPFPVTIEQTASALLDQLRRATTLEGRIQAAEALTRFRDDPALPIGIRGVLEQNPPLLVEHALLRTLGRLPGGGSRDALIRSRLTAAHPLLRTEAVRAVARSDSASISGSVLMERARAEENVYVQAAAVRGAARRKPEGWTSLLESAFVTDAPNEVIRRSAFDALGIGSVPPEDGLQPALTWSSAERDPLLRAAAPPYLVEVDAMASARNRLEQLLADPDLRVRLAAAEALRAVEASYAKRLIADRLENEPHPWVRRLLAPSSAPSSGL